MEWWAFAILPLIWAKAVWLSPNVKTYRHRLSAAFSVLAGGLLFASLRLERSAFPILFGAAILAGIVMFVALLWAPRPKVANPEGG